jgi:hypothetical protein
MVLVETPAHPVLFVFSDCLRPRPVIIARAFVEVRSSDLVKENGVGGRFNQYHWFQVAELLPKYLVGVRLVVLAPALVTVLTAGAIRSLYHCVSPPHDFR